MTNPVSSSSGRHLILARHGESEYSARGTLNGDPAIVVGLTEVGREQARRLGELLTGAPIDVCVTSEFARTRETAELALAGRSVPIQAVPELNDHPAGRYEGRPLEEYLAWAHGAGPADPIPGSEESRAAVVARYARGFRRILERPERTILAVLHSLPIVYVLGAAEGRNPAATLPLLPYAHPTTVAMTDVEWAVERLERWAAAPVW
jgi:broad specificity phosphatase PhoE